MKMFHTCCKVETELTVLNFKRKIQQTAKIIAKISLPLDAPEAIDILRHKSNLPIGKPSLSAHLHNHMH